MISNISEAKFSIIKVMQLKLASVNNRLIVSNMQVLSSLSETKLSFSLEA